MKSQLILVSMLPLSIFMFSCGERNENYSAEKTLIEIRDILDSCQTHDELPADGRSDVSVPRREAEERHKENPDPTPQKSDLADNTNTTATSDNLVKAVSKCQNVALVCPEIEVDDCGRQKGCQVRGNCGARQCAQHKSQASCVEAGCAPTFVCMGTPWTCHDFISELSCEKQLGCLWMGGTSSCIGFSLECDAANPGTCAQIQGCRQNLFCTNHIASSLCVMLGERHQCILSDICAWTEALECSGSALACDSFTAEETCKKQTGCAWK